MDAGRERNLVERCRRGDEGAFQELVEEHRSLVFALIAWTDRRICLTCRRRRGGELSISSLS